MSLVKELKVKLLSEQKECQQFRKVMHIQRNQLDSNMDKVNKSKSDLESARHFMNTQTKEVISDALNSAPLTTSFKQKKSQCEVQTNMIGNLDNQTLLSIVEQVNDQRQKI